MVAERGFCFLPGEREVAERRAILPCNGVLPRAPTNKRFDRAEYVECRGPVGFAGRVLHQLRVVGSGDQPSRVGVLVVRGEFCDIRTKGRTARGCAGVPRQYLLAERPPPREQPRPERPPRMRCFTRYRRRFLCERHRRESRDDLGAQCLCGAILLSGARERDEQFLPAPVVPPSARTRAGARSAPAIRALGKVAHFHRPWQPECLRCRARRRYRVRPRAIRAVGRRPRPTVAISRRHCAASGEIPTVSRLAVGINRGEWSRVGRLHRGNVELGELRRKVARPPAPRWTSRLRCPGCHSRVGGEPLRREERQAEQRTGVRNSGVHPGTVGGSETTPASASIATANSAAGIAFASRFRWNRASSFASCEKVVSLHPRHGCPVGFSSTGLQSAKRASASVAARRKSAPLSNTSGTAIRDRPGRRSSFATSP